ncbi:MAG: hypothetical protein U0791_01690 [Gemmataceae bacterium]
MLLGKPRSVRARITAILVATAAITAVGAGLPWLGAKLGLLGWPQASSWYGLLLGLVGGAIVFFEMAIWPRKQLRWLRLLPTKIWMRLHIWLGLVCLPVILVHTGFSIGGPLPAFTLILFLLVSASGVWGLVMQQMLPETLLVEVPGETVASQIGFVAEVHAAEAMRLVESLTTAPPEYDAFDPRAASLQQVAARGEPLVVGGPAIELFRFRDLVLLPFLKGAVKRKSPLRTRTESRRRFTLLRDSLPLAASPVVKRLEELADLRRQWDVQSRLNGWLHAWLITHLPLSVAMTGFMVIHAVRALKYW